MPISQGARARYTCALARAEAQREQPLERQCGRDAHVVMVADSSSSEGAMRFTWLFTAMTGGLSVSDTTTEPLKVGEEISWA